MTRRDAGYFALGVVLAIVAQGWSRPEIQLEFGQSRFGQAENGTFFESEAGYDYRNYMTPRAGSIAFADKFGESDWGYIIRGYKSGSIQARSNRCRYGDDMNRQPCDPKTTIGCLAEFNGVGYTYGISASLTREDRIGPFKVIGEVGVQFFRHRFAASARGLEAGAGDEQHYEATSNWGAPPAPLVGLTIRFKDVAYLAVRHHFAVGHRELTLTNHARTDVMFGIPFKL